MVHDKTRKFRQAGDHRAADEGRQGLLGMRASKEAGSRVDFWIAFLWKTETGGASVTRDMPTKSRGGTLR